MTTARFWEITRKVIEYEERHHSDMVDAIDYVFRMPDDPKVKQLAESHWRALKDTCRQENISRKRLLQIKYYMRCYEIEGRRVIQETSITAEELKVWAWMSHLGFDMEEGNVEVEIADDLLSL